jgi:SAM-dependent methyltransferase
MAEKVGNTGSVHQR